MNLRRFPATREISIGVLIYLYLPVLVLGHHQHVPCRGIVDLHADKARG